MCNLTELFMKLRDELRYSGFKKKLRVASFDKMILSGRKKQDG